MTQRMLCWHCGAPMIWGSDFTLEDYGEEGEGIISTFSCSACPATAEVRLEDEDGRTITDPENT